MARTPARDTACPRCGYALFVGAAAGMTLHACGHCGGVFLGTACAQRLLAAMPEGALALARSAATGARHAPDLRHVAPCPVCRAPMRRHLAAAAGVELDQCPSHGTWYDKDEVQRVVDAVRRSGWGARPGAAAAGAVAVGAAAVGAGALAAGAIAEPPPDSERQLEMLEAAEAGLDVAEVGADAVEGVADGAGEAAVEGIFAIFGAIFD